VKWRGKDVGLVDLGGCIRLLVLTVAKNAKCPFSRLRSDRSIAANAFQSIGVHVSSDVSSDVDANSVDPEKCTRQFAVTAAKRVKYHSNLLLGNQSIARNVGKSISLPDDTEWAARHFLEVFFCPLSIRIYLPFYCQQIKCLLGLKYRVPTTKTTFTTVIF